MLSSLSLDLKHSIPSHWENITNRPFTVESGENRQTHLSWLWLCLYLFSGPFIWTHSTEVLWGIWSPQGFPEEGWQTLRWRVESQSISLNESPVALMWMEGGGGDKIGKKKKYCNIKLRAVPGRTAHPSFKLQHSSRDLSQHRMRNTVHCAICKNLKAVEFCSQIISCWILKRLVWWNLMNFDAMDGLFAQQTLRLVKAQVDLITVPTAQFHWVPQLQW